MKNLLLGYMESFVARFVAKLLEALCLRPKPPQPPPKFPACYVCQFPCWAHLGYVTYRKAGGVSLCGHCYLKIVELSKRNGCIEDDLSEEYEREMVEWLAVQ